MTADHAGETSARITRPVWTGLGAISLTLGAVGIPLPILPTTPFLILAAYCFARGSPRMHDWLVAHALFGPSIRDWREQRAVSTAAKCAALGAMVLVLALSIFLRVPIWALIIEGAILTSVAIFLLTRPAPTSAGNTS